MNYFNYISNYLSTPIDIINKSSRLILKENWPDYFTRQFVFLNDYSLSDVVLFSVPNKDFEFKGKNRTSEAHYKQKLILCNNEYIDRGNDPNASFIHNLAHIQQYQQVGEELFSQYQGEKVFEDIDCLYPNNKVELYAFSIELKYLKSIGVSGEFFLDFMRRYSEEPCREDFFKRLIKHIY